MRDRLKYRYVTNVTNTSEASEYVRCYNPEHAVLYFGSCSADGKSSDSQTSVCVRVTWRAGENTDALTPPQRYWFSRSEWEPVIYLPDKDADVGAPEDHGAGPFWIGTWPINGEVATDEEATLFAAFSVSLSSSSSPTVRYHMTSFSQGLLDGACPFDHFSLEDAPNFSQLLG